MSCIDFNSSEGIYQCLQGQVGLRGICEDTGSYTIWINDLPGIEMQNFSKTATSEDITGKNLFLKLEREASLQVTEDFLTKLSETMQWNSVLRTDVIGRWNPEYGSKNSHYYDTANCLIGKEIYLNSSDPYIDFTVDYIEIMTKTTVTKTITIEDHYNTTTIEADLIPGLNRVEINYKGTYVKVYFDISDIELVRQGYCSCQYPMSCSKCCYGHLIAHNIRNCDGEGWKYGADMAFRVSVRSLCDKERLVCKFKEELRYSMRWKITALLMTEILYSDRVNPLVRNKKGEAERYLVKIEGGIDPLTGFKEENPLYWKSIGQAVKRVSRSIGQTQCTHCSGDRLAEIIF